jgi:RNA polymerase sigma-70 factor (ECF subfamily)
VLEHEVTGDADLLVRAIRGDRAAFATLYDRHAAAVYGYALKLTADPGTAEDVVQEAFLGLLKGVRYDARRPFMAWLLTIARNEAYDLLRRRRARREAGLDGAPEPAAAAGPDPGTRDHVEAALRALPDEFREAVWLCDGMEMSYQEAAEIMRCEIGTVGSRVARGRALLRRELSRTGHAV